MIELKDWQQQAIALHNTNTMSWRDISGSVGVPKSTVSDFLRKYESFKSDVTEDTQLVVNDNGSTHLVIFDTQVRPGISLDYLRQIGEYIVRKRPDVIIHIGDHADMPSLSSYDKGKRKAEGKRYEEDVKASIAGMWALLSPLKEFQHQQVMNGTADLYTPRMVLTLGNHEDRINRYANENPELHGKVSINDLKYEEMGWEVIDFLTPINIDGINYCHYFPNVMTGKPLGGSAANMLKTIGESFTMGHRQLLDVSTRSLQASGDRQWGVICGSSYVHDEDYKGVQGNKHWRGVLVKHNVKNGDYDPLFVSMNFLEKEYGNE